MKITPIILGALSAIPIALASVPAKRWYFANCCKETIQPNGIPLIAIILLGIAVYIYLKNK